MTNKQTKCISPQIRKKSHEFHPLLVLDMGVIVIRPPWLRCEFLAELPLVLIFWSLSKVLDSPFWASIQGSLQSQHLFPELEATFSRKSRWGCIPIRQNACSRSLNQNCGGIFWRPRFGAIYSVSKTKKYLFKNSTIGNRLLFSKLANIEFTCPENSNWWLLLPDSNLFLKFQSNFTAEFWATFSYGLLLQRFFWNSSGIFIISIKADTRNFSKKYQQFFFTRCDFLWTVGSF